MILFDIDHPQSCALSAPLLRAVDFLRTLTQETENGRYELDGDALYAVVSEEALFPKEERNYEAHARYIDVHCALLGTEGIEWMPVSAFPEQAINEKTDIVFYNENPEGTVLTIEKRIAAIFYPEDAHKPLCRIANALRVKKCVVKALQTRLSV